MALFKRKTTKLHERLVSLEDHLGVAYADKDGYHEHVNDAYGTLPKLLEDVKELTKKKGKK